MATDWLTRSSKSLELASLGDRVMESLVSHFFKQTDAVERSCCQTGHAAQAFSQCLLELDPAIWASRSTPNSVSPHGDRYHDAEARPVSDNIDDQAGSEARSRPRSASTF